MTKLIFMGTPNFSATVLKGLLSDDRYEIVAVVTQPDRAVGRKKVIQETPVKQAAKEAGLPIYQPEKLSGSPEMEAIMNLGADGIVTAAFGQFLPSKLLDSMDFCSQLSMLHSFLSTVVELLSNLCLDSRLMRRQE